MARPIGISVVATLTILFGLAEIATAFTHNFLGVTTPVVSMFTYAAALIGMMYIVSGLLILTMRKRAVVVALVLLVFDIAGRIALVASGLYPTTSFKQNFAIVTGTVVVALFALYIGSKWRLYR
jgi:hypothetical protein